MSWPAYTFTGENYFSTPPGDTPGAPCPQPGGYAPPSMPSIAPPLTPEYVAKYIDFNGVGQYAQQWSGDQLVTSFTLLSPQGLQQYLAGGAGGGGSNYSLPVRVFPFWNAENAWSFVGSYGWQVGWPAGLQQIGDVFFPNGDGQFELSLFSGNSLAWNVFQYGGGNSGITTQPPTGYVPIFADMPDVKQILIGVNVQAFPTNLPPNLWQYGFDGGLNRWRQIPAFYYSMGVVIVLLGDMASPNPPPILGRSQFFYPGAPNIQFLPGGQIQTLYGVGNVPQIPSPVPPPLATLPYDAPPGTVPWQFYQDFGDQDPNIRPIFGFDPLPTPRPLYALGTYLNQLTSNDPLPTLGNGIVPALSDPTVQRPNLLQGCVPLAPFVTFTSNGATIPGQVVANNGASLTTSMNRIYQVQFNGQMIQNSLFVDYTNVFGPPPPGECSVAWAYAIVSQQYRRAIVQVPVGPYTLYLV